MKRLLTLLLLAIATTTVWCEDLATVKTKIIQTSSSIQTLQCTFVQTRSVKMLKNKTVSQGRMLFEQKEKLRWEYTEPNQFIFVMNNGRTYLKKGNSETVTDADGNKMMRNLTMMMMPNRLSECLNDDKNFSIKITSTADAYVATLFPLRKDLRRMYSSIAVAFNKKTYHVSSILLSEPSGDTTTIELHNIKINSKITEKEFNLQ